jgi:MFS family permease
MTTIDLTIVNVSLPTIGRVLHFSPTNLQWVATANALTFGGFLLLGGRAADLLVRRRILMLGLAVFTAASLGCALAVSEDFLIAMRAAQGLGAAMMLPAALSIVMNMFQEGAERNKALGIWGGLGAGGGTVGLIAGGVITRYLGWEYTFYLNVPIGAVALALVPRIVPDSRIAGSRRRFDVPGAITGTTGLVLLVEAISQAPQYGWGATRTLGLLAGSAAMLVTFLIIETRTEDPLLPLSIFRLRTLAGANIDGADGRFPSDVLGARSDRAHRAPGGLRARATIRALDAARHSPKRRGAARPRHQQLSQPNDQQHMRR